MSGYLPERSLLLSHWMSSRPPKRSVSPVAQASCLSPGGLSAYLLCFFTVTSCLIPPTPTICSCVMGLFCCLEWGALSLSCHDFGYFLLLFCLKFILSFTSFLVSHLVCTDYTLLLSISLSPPQHLNFWFSFDPFVRSLPHACLLFHTHVAATSVLRALCFLVELNFKDYLPAPVFHLNLDLFPQQSMTRIQVLSVLWALKMKTVLQTPYFEVEIQFFFSGIIDPEIIKRCPTANKLTLKPSVRCITQSTVKVKTGIQQ